MQQATEAFLEHKRAEGLSPHTLGAYQRELRRFGEYLAGCGVCAPGQVTREHVLAYRMSLSEQAARTIGRRIATLQSFFRFLKERGEIADKPTDGIPLPRIVWERRHVLSESETKRLLGAATSMREQAIIVLLLQTGIRRGEVGTLRVADIDWERGAILVRGKGQKQRDMPMTEDVRRALKVLLAEHNGSPIKELLVSQYGEAYSPHGIGWIMRNIVARAGLAGHGITPHTFRRTFATGLDRRGVGLRTIQELMGHASPATTAAYIFPDWAGKQAAVNTLGAVGTA